MSVFVVDASLVIKWFMPEVDRMPPDGGSTRRMTTSHRTSCFLRSEATMWKKVRRGELSPDHSQRLVTDLSVIAVEAVSMRGLCRTRMRWR